MLTLPKNLVIGEVLSRVLFLLLLDMCAKTRRLLSSSPGFPAKTKDTPTYWAPRDHIHACINAVLKTALQFAHEQFCTPATMDFSENSSSVDNSSFSLDDADPGILIVFGIANSISGLVGLTLNVYLLVILCYDRECLEGAVTRVLTQVLAGNIIQIISFGLPISITAFAKGWILGNVTCYILTGFQLIGFSIRWVMVGVYSTHCFCTVFFPFKYPNILTSVLNTMIMIAWITTIIFAVAMVPTNNFTFIMNYPLCSIDHQNTAFLCISCILLFIGTAVPTILFVSLWIKAKKVKKIELGTFSSTKIAKSSILDRIKHQKKSACTLCLMLSITVAVALVMYLNIILATLPVSNNGELSANFILTLAISLCPATDILFITRNVSIKMSIMKINQKFKGSAVHFTSQILNSSTLK